MTFLKNFYPLALLYYSSHFVYAAGYQLQERSTSGLGRAFAGEAAIAEDASAIATNAASLLLLDGTQVSAGVSFIAPSVDLDGTFSGIPASDTGVAKDAIVPYSYLSHKLNEDFAVGLAMHSRFGLSTEYSDDFLASSFAQKSEIITVYLSPKVAYQLNDRWSIGAGFDAVYAEGELTNAVPSGPSIAEISGDGWNYGFNAGLIYQYSDRTRFGITYYSEVDLTLEGDVTSETGIPAISPPDGKVDAKVESTLPASIELSAYHELSDQWMLHGSFTWTGWSTFDELLIQTDNGNLPPTIENWKDVYRVAVGTTYKHNKEWTFRAGFAFDESPVRSSKFRTLRIPDSDRYWASIGTTYAINEHYKVDFGYTHVFANDAKIAEGSYEGTASGNVNIVGLSFNGKF